MSLRYYYKFKDNANDSSGNGYDGALSATPPATATYESDTPASWSSKSLFFEGAATIPYFSASDPSFIPTEFTVSFWLKSVGDAYVLITALSGVASFKFQTLASGQVIVGMGSSVFSLGNDSCINDEWHKYSYSHKDGVATNFYRDDELLATGLHTNPLANWQGVKLESVLTNRDYYIDDFRVYDTALTAEQIALLPYSDVAPSGQITPEIIDRFSGDPKMYLTQDGTEISMVDGQPIMDAGLENQAMISLFTSTGWWGNIFAKTTGEVIGSDFETVSKRPITIDSLALNEQSAAKALESKYFGDVDVNITNPNSQRLDMNVVIRPPAADAKTLATSRVGQKWLSQSKQGE